jgi:uncharacterized protein (TIGR04255 family)
VSMFELPAVSRYRLERPPLVQAIGQVRFPVRADLGSLAGIAPIQARLQSVFPYLRQQQIQQVSLLVGAGAPPMPGGQMNQLWRFEDDSGWALEIAADTASLIVGPTYGDFGEFSDRFHKVLTALADGAGAARADRLGIRYLNIAEIPPGEEAAWRQWFRPEFTGWSGSEVIASGTRLTTTLTQTQLAAQPVGDLAGPPVEIQAIIRHGLVPAGTFVPGAPTQVTNPAYLLDTDIYVEGPQPFSPAELSRQLTVFHDQIDRFFFWILTDEGLAYFGSEEAL